jgi:hypothetical protein
MSINDCQDLSPTVTISRVIPVDPAPLLPRLNTHPKVLIPAIFDKLRTIRQPYVSPNVILQICNILFIQHYFFMSALSAHFPTLYTCARARMRARYSLL